METMFSVEEVSQIREWLNSLAGWMQEHGEEAYEEQLSEEVEKIDKFIEERLS